jgi:hypothetical protein
MPTDVSLYLSADSSVRELGTDTDVYNCLIVTCINDLSDLRAGSTNTVGLVSSCDYNMQTITRTW